jgi:oligopeptidase B
MASIDAIAFGSVAVLGTAIGVLRRNLTELPPRARRQDHKVLFGKVSPPSSPHSSEDESDDDDAGEEEGLMDPPVERNDDLFWLRSDDRSDKEVISHLEAENEYTIRKCRHLEGVRKELYTEILSRIQETDVNLPFLRRGWYYYDRTVKGSSYPIHCRKPAPASSASRSPRTPR